MSKALDTTRIPNGSFKHKRTIDGIRVLVRAEPDGNGITPESFIVRFLLPTGKVDRTCGGNYYWQAFNEARKIMREL